MNPNNTNPLMFILEADPERYLKTPAATLLVLLKTVEGVAAIWCTSQTAAFVRALMSGRAEALPIELLKSALPAELTALLPQGTLPSGGTVGTALAALAALCLFTELLCLMLEGVASLYLRFALGGSKLFKLTRKAAFLASLGLALCVTVSFAVSVLEAFKGKMNLLSLLYPSLVTAGCALLLWLRVLYNRGASTVISVVEYEIRLGFKESVEKELDPGRHALLLCLAFLAAAAYCVYTDWRMISSCIPALLAVKYAAARSSWRIFRRCHR